jgi:hypothetical protein
MKNGKLIVAGNLFLSLRLHFNWQYFVRCAQTQSSWKSLKVAQVSLDQKCWKSLLMLVISIRKLHLIEEISENQKKNIKRIL